MRHMISIASALITALALAGCYGTLSPAIEPEGSHSDVVFVAQPPMYVETYPRTYYNGGYAYYVGDRWYYERDHRWRYFQNEPRELRHYRAQPAPRVYRAPPAR